ncbi:TadE/TadG family type IV pilus assembly protein [Ferrimonas futtsuensis]|uniref:TadE/TadG family type IV pilus assembly protein n=1 Tax=Ferrimonas futtsuensis TaxID=364764 RepID=UPI0003FC862D|nr:TadE/TadG family type IV pilus assembly protein [Ferrimonas futtsuensis]
MLALTRATRSKQRGVAAIEAMVTLPLLFLLFFGVGELGRLMYQYNQLNSVVRDACRYVAAKAISANNGASDLVVQPELQNTAKALALYGKSSGTTPLLTGLQADDISITVSGGDLITVTATYNWTSIFSGNLAGNYGETVDYNFPLTATISMRAIP